MSWIRLAYRTLQAERTNVAVYLANTGILMLIYNLLLDRISIAYPLLMSSVLLAGYLLHRAYDLHRFAEELDAVRTAGIVPRYADNARDALAFAAISDIHAAYQGKLEALGHQLAGRNTLFTSFIHNMKSSAAVIELAANAPNADKLADIALENEKLKRNLDQALALLRLDEFANDYVPECIDLRELVSAVINEKRRDFIYAGVYPKLGEANACVYTDRKWAPI